MRQNTMTGRVTAERGRARITPVKAAQTGFTIVETLIVLAVTGVLFASVITMVGGKQNKTEFNQAINNVKNQLDQIINEVNAGYYPNGADFSCQVNALTGNVSIHPLLMGTPANEQGSNNGCIFIGKAIHFSTALSPEPFYVYTLAAAQHDGSGNITTSIQQASPVIVSIPNSSSNVITNTLQYGLTTVYMKEGTSGPSIGSFAFVNSLSPASSSTGVVSGSIEVNLLPIPVGGISDIDATAQRDINNWFHALTPAQTDDTLLSPTSGIAICFASGGTDQSGLITIGGGAGQVLSTTLKIFNGTSCT